MKKYTLSSTVTRSRIDYRADLNSQQYAVVTAEDGPILVVAGAGSGKTRTLTYRVAHLLDRGIPPAGIVLCTFTNKAAREMLTRVEHLVEGNVRQVWGGTFHHLANRLLRRRTAHVMETGSCASTAPVWATTRGTSSWIRRTPGNS